MLPMLEDPIKHLREYRGEVLIETVTDTEQMNSLCGGSATQRLERFRKLNPGCTVRYVGSVAYLYVDPSTIGGK